MTNSALQSRPQAPSAIDVALAALRKLLADESLAPDEPLPTERALSDRFGISRRTIRQALFELEAEGKKNLAAAGQGNLRRTGAGILGPVAEQAGQPHEFL